MARISIIAAIGRNREIGKAGKLLWPIMDDLRNFKTVTMGKPIIMGRKTFESIGRPLPGRKNIVITRSPSFSVEGVVVTNSLSEALKAAQEAAQETGVEEIFVIGGGEIYQEALPLANHLYLTRIDASEPEADAFFPEYEQLFPITGMESARLRDNANGLYYQFVVLHK